VASAGRTLRGRKLDGTITIETDDPGFPRLTVAARGKVVD